MTLKIILGLQFTLIALTSCGSDSDQSLPQDAEVKALDLESYPVRICGRGEIVGEETTIWNAAYSAGRVVILNFGDQKLTIKRGNLSKKIIDRLSNSEKKVAICGYGSRLPSNKHKSDVIEWGPDEVVVSE